MAPAGPAYLIIPKDIGDWLARSNGIANKHITRSDPANRMRPDEVEVDQAAAKDITDGTAVCRVLNFYGKDNNQIPAPNALKEESTAGARLHNWNMLTVALEHFGVRLDPDMKGLIVGGDTDVILDILGELRQKTDKPSTRQRRGSEGTTRQASAASRRGSQNNRGSDEVSLDLKKLDQCSNVEESSNALDFLVISMCKKLGVRAKQAAALLTANTKYLSHMMEKGIKGSFDAVDAWYAEIFKHNALLGGLMIQNPSTIPFVLSTLKWGFGAQNEESANWLSRIFANLGANLQSAGHGPVLCDWLVTAAAGATAGLTTLLKCLQLHPGTAEAVHGVIIQFGEGRLREVFETHLPRLATPEEWMELVQGMLPLLQSTRSSRGEPVLATALVHALVASTLQFGEADNTEDCRVSAFQLLARLWSECAEELTERRESLDGSLEVLKKGTRSATAEVAQEAQAQLFLLLDLMGGIGYSDGVSACYRTLVLIMLELPKEDPLHRKLSQQLAERLRKNSHLSPAIVVEPLVKQIAAEGAAPADLDFIAVIASHGKLSRQHGEMLIEILGPAWSNANDSGRLTAGEGLTGLAARFKGDQGMPHAVAASAQGILECFSSAEPRLHEEAVDLLQRVAQLGGTSAQSAVAGSVDRQIQRLGGNETLEALLSRLGGVTKAAKELAPKEPKAPTERPLRKASAARGRQVEPKESHEEKPAPKRERSKGRDEMRDPREERAAREERESRGRPKNHGRPEPIQVEAKESRPSEAAMPDPRLERKKKERRKTDPSKLDPIDPKKEVPKFKREKVVRSPTPEKKKKPDWAIEPSKEWEALTDEEKAVRKEQQRRLRAKRLEELRQIKVKREEDAARKKRRDQEQRARSADLKEKLAQNRIRDYERAQQARAHRIKVEADQHQQQQQAEAVQGEVARGPKSAPASKREKPFYLREDPTQEIIENCTNKYPHEHRLHARAVCELLLDLVDEAIDPVGTALAKKELADAKGEAEVKPFKAQPGPKAKARAKARKHRAPSVEPSERETPAMDSDGSSDIDEEAQLELQRKLEKEKARLERAERSHAKIAAYRARRAQEQQEMAEADARLEAIKKQQQDQKREHDRRLRAQKKEEVRLWREAEERKQREDEAAKEKEDIAMKRERQRAVQEYLERREARDKRKKKEMEMVAHGQEEEAIVLAEAEAAAKKEADEKRKKQQAARRKKAADKKAAEDQAREELENEAAETPSPPALGQTAKRGEADRPVEAPSASAQASTNEGSETQALEKKEATPAAPPEPVPAAAAEEAPPPPQDTPPQEEEPNQEEPEATAAAEAAEPAVVPEPAPAAEEPAVEAAVEEPPAEAATTKVVAPDGTEEDWSINPAPAGDGAVAKAEGEAEESPAAT